MFQWGWGQQENGQFISFISLYFLIFLQQILFSIIYNVPIKDRYKWVAQCEA
jgi:hypothetical protein